MTELGGKYQAFIEDAVSCKSPSIPFYSSVTGKLVIGEKKLSASYWRQNLESPVLFYPAVVEILNAQSHDKLFLEIGPHSGLAGPLRQIFKTNSISNATYVSVQTRDTNCSHALLTAAGHLHINGLPLDFSEINPAGKVPIDLPIYSWHHETEYWNESRLSREWRLRRFPHHDILGSRIAEGTELEPSWRNVLRLEDVPWIKDHMISKDIIFPGAGYVTMAGEAIRQITKTDDYTIRNMTIKAALVLKEGKATEIVTHFRPLRLTDSLESHWFEFSIVSHNGNGWTNHCAGQARAGPSQEQLVPQIETLPRKIRAPQWYQTMRKVGLNYGPAFQPLAEISAGTTTNTATACMKNYIGEYESTYQFHPATIDGCIQLFSVALCNGTPRKMRQLSVPTYIEEIYIRRPLSSFEIAVSASASAKGIVTGNGIAVADNRVVLQVKGLRLSPLEEDSSAAANDPHAAVQLEWKPDLHFLDLRSLIVPTKKANKGDYLLVEKLALLCMIETAHRIATVETKLSYLEKFRSWVNQQTELAKQGEHKLLAYSNRLANLDSSHRLALIEATAREVQHGEGALIGTALMRIFESSLSIFDGSTNPLELLLQDEVLTKLYDFADKWDIRLFFDYLSHKKPNLKVLEIGAGTGATTATVLSALRSGDEYMYSRYTYTDISAGFFVLAKERFKHVPNIDYTVLDISKDAVEQGFEAGTYDLIVATNVLHATPVIRETLQNARRLLRPGGRLFLRAAGFPGAEVVIYDDEVPYQTNAHILSSCPLTVPIKSKKVTLLCSTSGSALVRQVEASFLAAGFTVDLCTLIQQPPPNQDIVSLLDLDEPFFHDISPSNFQAFINFVTKLGSTGMLWVTMASQLRCKDPRYSLVLGMARTIRNELSVDFATLEMDNYSWTSLVKVFTKFQHREKDPEIDPEYEYALAQGIIRIGRFDWFNVMKELSAPEIPSAPKRLEIGRRGFLKTLGWVQQPETGLVGDQIEVEVRAVGMNFKV
jgi:SAM-dependent methyltransferase